MKTTKKIPLKLFKRDFNNKRAYKFLKKINDLCIELKTHTKLLDAKCNLLVKNNKKNKRNI